MPGAEHSHGSKSVAAILVRLLHSALTVFGFIVTMRRIFIILLALLLPLNGWAATRLVEPCPMQMSKTAHFTAMKSNCCEDRGQATDKTSNPCKPGQECQTGALHFTATPIASLEFLTSAQPVIRFASQIADAAPSGVWRPPRL